MRFMKRVLLFCLAELVLFSLFACVYQCVTGQELSPTLVQYHYSVFGIELGAMALLKIAEITITKISNKRSSAEDETERREREWQN